MIQLGISDQPVLVLTMPRTGSTAFCRRLADDLGFAYYSEPFNPLFAYPWYVFDDLKVGKKFVFKIFPDHNVSKHVLDELCEKCFVIYLERANLIEQIASYHTLSITKKAWFAKSEIKNSYMVNLDDSNISYSIEQILDLRESAKTYRQRADISLKYEDIQELLENDHMRPYDRPENYEELTKKIQDMLPLYLNKRSLLELDDVIEEILERNPNFATQIEEIIRKKMEEK